jgi:hypothetical protein
LTWLRARGFAVLLVAVGCMSAGCLKSTPGMTDKEEAIATLRTALEAWQNGEAPIDLKERNPAISVADPAWARGAQLVKFEIDEAGDQSVGYDLRFPVKLWLAGDTKAPLKSKFVVTTTPALVVVRDVGN